MTSNAERSDRLSAALRAMIECDRDELTRSLTPDVRVWTPEVAAESLEGLLDALQRRDEAFSDIDLRVTPLDVGGDRACGEWSVTMQHSGRIDLADGTTIEPTGERIALHGATVAEFLGDRICSLRQYWDRNSLLEQLGPPPRDA